MTVRRSPEEEATEELPAPRECDVLDRRRKGAFCLVALIAGVLTLHLLILLGFLYVNYIQENNAAVYLAKKEAGLLTEEEEKPGLKDPGLNKFTQTMAQKHAELHAKHPELNLAGAHEELSALAGIRPDGKPVKGEL
eukprot:gnl/TRDRNA2_/TRDRNA2_85598_c0_seq2.p1 gnl/TRDRNA2_/TRDRNA2_85598_c0~~gnl/TRDRNA2_/TRDRNA2_85598_c0_seq2.p1  ORF type:complete len:137 (+),score=35.77 gnl/TRDRNA2_/TRDRNA2_85598_c0_seq2:52-462(+)